LADLVAIIGADTLLGREVRDSLEQSRLDIRVREVSVEMASSRVVTRRDDDELGIMPPLGPESLQDVRLAFLTGDAASARQAFELAASSAVTLIDLTGGLADLPSARLSAPMVTGGVDGPGTHVIAHPAAIALAIFFEQLCEQFAVARWTVTALEPASERGRAGVEELQQQTIALLSFKQIPQAVFDAQLAFNVLPKYGDDAPLGLAAAEERLVAHYASISSARPLPSLRLIQAPVFHGHVFSIWAEFEEPVAVDDLEAALVSDWIDVRRAATEPPTNTGVAQQAGAQVSVQFDRMNPRAAWFHLAADNVKLMADNAVLVAKAYLAPKRERVQ